MCLGVRGAQREIKGYDWRFVEFNRRAQASLLKLQTQTQPKHKIKGNKEGIGEQPNGSQAKTRWLNCPTWQIPTHFPKSSPQPPIKINQHTHSIRIRPIQPMPLGHSNFPRFGQIGHLMTFTLKNWHQMLQCLANYVILHNWGYSNFTGLDPIRMLQNPQIFD